MSSIRIAKKTIFGLFCCVGVAAFPAAATLPAGWTSRDVGTVGLAGDAEHTRRSFTIEGAGVRIGKSKVDGFHFVYQRLVGDGQIRAKVTHIDHVDPHAKAGVMIREELAADSVHSTVSITPTNGVRSVTRLVEGQSGDSERGNSHASAPYWVRLVRRGDTFRAYESKSGVAWTLVDTRVIEMTPAVYIGLAMTSRDVKTLAVAEFSNVAVKNSRDDSDGGDTDVHSGDAGIWISDAELAALPTSGAAWDRLKEWADSDCGIPDLYNMNQTNNVCIMAKALVFARIGGDSYRSDVVSALRTIASSGPYTGNSLSLGRELGAYVIAADLIDLESRNPALNQRFEDKLTYLRAVRPEGRPTSLITCHETRPNNFFGHCGFSRLAIAAYLQNQGEIEWIAKVFKGWLGDRSAYAGFEYGDLYWQCDHSKPVGINPEGCTKKGHSTDGVLPDDQRRAEGGFTWPPPKENYVWEGLQGALAQAVILDRYGYDVWNWEDKALLRAVEWLHEQADYPAEGDDTWQLHVINHFYGTNFPAPVPTRPGKNVGWTDWTH